MAGAAPSQAACQGSFGFISRARHPGNRTKACLGQEEVLVLLWTPGLAPEGLFSFQAALQHSHKKGFAMQRKTSHPPRGSVWAGSGAGSSCAPTAWAPRSCSCPLPCPGPFLPLAPSPAQVGSRRPPEHCAPRTKLCLAPWR